MLTIQALYIMFNEEKHKTAKFIISKSNEYGKSIALYYPGHRHYFTQLGYNQQY